MKAMAKSASTAEQLISDGRNARGHFTNGHNHAGPGRPAGISPVTFARRVWEKTNAGEDILKVVLGILNNENEKTQYRLQAAELLLDRGLGKAVQTVELQTLATKEGSAVPSVDFSKFSPEELETYHDLLLKAHQGEQTIHAQPLAITAEAGVALEPEHVAQGELVTDGEELFGKVDDDGDSPDQDA